LGEADGQGREWAFDERAARRRRSGTLEARAVAYRRESDEPALFVGRRHP
jgi:hypothetical protein